MPGPLAEQKPSSFFASMADAEQITEYTVGEYADGRQTEILMRQRLDSGLFSMVEDSTSWSKTALSATMETGINGTDNIVDWLKSPSSPGIVGAWLKEATSTEPIAVSVAQEISFKADLGARALIGSLSAAAVAIAAFAF